MKRTKAAKSARAENAENKQKNSGGKAEWLRKYQFKPGKSGNAGGRPKSTGVGAQLRELLASGKTSREVAQAIITAACKGDAAMMRVLLDRSDGTVQQQIAAHLTGTVASAMPFTSVQIVLPANGREANAADLERTITVPPKPAEIPVATSEPVPESAPVATERMSEPEPVREPTSERIDPRLDSNSPEYVPACFRAGVLNAPLR